MVLKKGMQSQAVEGLQKGLIELGYLSIGSSGLFSDATEQAVIAFQKANGLHPDGVVGNQTLTALYAYLPSVASLIEGDLPQVGKMDKASIIADKTGVEAGYVNNPDDAGGETNHGITVKTANQYKDMLVSQFHWDGTMKGLTQDMAFAIYAVGYWNPLRLTDVCLVDPYLADKLFDIGINTGIERAGKWLQMLLCVLNKKGRLYPDIAVDGQVGNKTIQTLQDCFKAIGSKKAGWAIMKGLLAEQGHHYTAISYAREANETFFMGWMNRLEHNVALYAKYYIPNRG